MQYLQPPVYNSNIKPSLKERVVLVTARITWMSPSQKKSKIVLSRKNNWLLVKVTELLF